MFFRYFPPKNSSVATAMQRFFEENYRKNLSLKFIHINNVTHLDDVIYANQVFNFTKH
ncbi:MAG: hypothetical protein ACI85O_001002 [Saprospiraceae bacterium]